MTDKRIELKHPITWFEKPLSVIELREPNGMDFVELGEPQTYVKGRDNSIYQIENDAVIKAYLERVMKVDGGTNILPLLSMVDAMALKNGLLGFFADAAKELSLA